MAHADKPYPTERQTKGGGSVIFGKHINKYYLKFCPMLILGTLALWLVDYAQLIIPKLYRMVINGVRTGEVSVDGAVYGFDMDFLLDRICLPLIFIIIVMVMCRFLWRFCFLGSGILVEADLRSKMFDRCKDLSQQYYQENKVGTLMSYFTNDLGTIQECFGWGIMMFFDALLLGVMALIEMFKMDTTLTLLSMIPLVFLLICSLIVGKYMSLKWERRQEAFSELSDFSQETFAGLAVIKAFVKEGYELSKFSILCKKNENENVSYTRLSMLLNASLSLFIETIICVILGYGGYLVYSGEFDAGRLVEFIGYFTSIIWPVMAVSELIGMYAQGKASLKRVSELLEQTPDVADRAGLESMQNIRGDIEFKGLTFAYPGCSDNVLEDISFSVHAGERIGIIGRTGSGKSTLVDLILRTYNIPRGMLFVDGVDINDIPIKDIRAAAAYVPQDNFLFSDTIENNIAFASDSSDHDDVVHAAKMADVHDNISEFPLQYNSVLGERGVTVSGGQKQRISIARALMKNAPILILDDSVSAVDVNTEKAILANLKSLREGKTTILIAHRISTVEGMDKILFLEGGKVSAYGTHAELCNTCEGYRNLVELQKLSEGEEDRENA